MRRFAAAALVAVLTVILSSLAFAIFYRPSPDAAKTGSPPPSSTAPTPAASTPAAQAR